MTNGIHSIRKYGRLTQDFDIECPKCHSAYITPKGLNPFNGRVETMVLKPDGNYNCPCGTVFYITPEDCRRHNHHHFPDDPEFKPKEEDDVTFTR